MVGFNEKRGDFFTAARSEGGVTMLEFALVASVFLVLLCAVIDFTIAFRKYSALTHVTQDVARSVSTQSLNCPALRAAAERAVASEMTNRYGFDAANVTVNAATSPSSGSMFLSINSALQLSCLFCKAVPGGMTLRTESRARVEGARCR